MSCDTCVRWTSKKLSSNIFGVVKNKASFVFLFPLQPCMAKCVCVLWGWIRQTKWTVNLLTLVLALQRSVWRALAYSLKYFNTAWLAGKCWVRWRDRGQPTALYLPQQLTQQQDVAAMLRGVCVYESVYLRPSVSFLNVRQTVRSASLFLLRSALTVHTYCNTIS